MTPRTYQRRLARLRWMVAGALPLPRMYFRYSSTENELHWVLDIALNEDHSRVRKDQAPENLAVLRHIALNSLKHEKTAKGGIHAKQLQPGWKEDYLLKVLASGV